MAVLPLGQEWDAALDDLKKRAPSLEHHRIIVELAKIVVPLGDGHTRLTLPVDPVVAARPENYALTTYTHIFSAGYGSPEVDHTTPDVTGAEVSPDGLSVR